MDLLKSRTILLNHGSAEDKRREILNYFLCTFDLDSRLYDHLKTEEAFTLRAEPLRHPLIFYYGHTARFYINKLTIARLAETRINPAFESMFAIGVDEMSWDDLNQQNYNWPTIEEVRNYRLQVREYVAQLIKELPLTIPITWDSPFWVIMMGIEHQRIHIETSSVIMRRLPLHHLQPLVEWTTCPYHGKAPANALIDVPGDTVTMGKDHSHPLYGWDNEFGVSSEEVWDFTAAKHLVSNEEFLQFVEDKGYSTEEYGTAEGWAWINYTKTALPLFLDR